VVFGSSNDTSMLRMFQTDSGGEAMVAGPTGATLGYWPMNGTRTDLSTVGNDIAAFPSAPNDPAWSSSAPAGRDRSIDFDGNDWAIIPSNAAYNVTSYTVDLWARTTTSGSEIASRATMPCDSGVPAGLCQWEFWTDVTGRLQANLEVGTTEHAAISNVVVTDGSWHHLAMTVDNATKTIRLYVDGALVATDTTWSSGSPETGTLPITIGANAYLATYIDGQVDELRFQSGVRTAADIRSYFQGRIGDYADSSNDWDTTAASTRMFGACLRAASDGATTNAGTWTVDSSCPTTDGAWWKPVAATNVTAGSKVASAPSGDSDARVSLRFGMRVPVTQPPGTYTAPIAFEVVAPDA
jgi:hypothetical protein